MTVRACIVQTHFFLIKLTNEWNRQVDQFTEEKKMSWNGASVDCWRCISSGSQPVPFIPYILAFIHRKLFIIHHRCVTFWRLFCTCIDQWVVADMTESHIQFHMNILVFIKWNWYAVGLRAHTHTHIVTMNLQRNIIMFGLCSRLANWSANYYLLFLNVFITFARRITQSIANRFRFLFSGRRAFGTEFCAVGQNEYRKETIIVVSQCDILLPNRKETHTEINESIRIRWVFELEFTLNSIRICVPIYSNEHTCMRRCSII